VGYDEDLNCLDTQEGSSQLLQNICNYVPINTATYSRKQIFSCSWWSSGILHSMYW